ncbi:MAG: two-component system response regulator [Acidobacteria bacterium]|nr:MAG: two-component system response regulator [Acidobacteriota bacterium]
MTPQVYEILLVEDDPADAELTVHALRKERLANHIEVARDGAEALDFLFCRGAYSNRSFTNPPRVVLLDLKLPKISGHEVLRAMKEDERTRAIPVVVLTSSNQERDLVECYQLGVNSYIQKPVDLQKFQEVVRHFGMYWLVVNHLPPLAAYSGK